MLILYIFGGLLIMLLILALVAAFMSFVVLLMLRVPFVRTPKHAIDALVASKLISEHDLVYDLGAGDGKFLQQLVHATGCRAEGFELSPFFWFLGELRASKSLRWAMHMQNVIHIDLSEPTVIFTFLAPAGLPALSRKLQEETRPGQTIISYGFEMPGWTPTQVISPTPENLKASKFYVYKKA